MSKLPIILEAVWLVLSIMCLALGTHTTIKLGFTSNGNMFFVLALVAAFMYIIRRYRRKRMSSNSNS
jgi:membrane protein implicated in regulation of membrane protease activity